MGDRRIGSGIKAIKRSHKTSQSKTIELLKEQFRASVLKQGAQKSTNKSHILDQVRELDKQRSGLRQDIDGNLQELSETEKSWKLYQKLPEKSRSDNTHLEFLKDKFPHYFDEENSDTYPTLASKLNAIDKYLQDEIGEKKVEYLEIQTELEALIRKIADLDLSEGQEGGSFAPLSSSKRKFEGDNESSQQPKNFKQDSSDVTSEGEPFDFCGGDD